MSIETEIGTTTQRWQFSNIKESEISDIATKYDLDPLLAKLILIRGLTDKGLNLEEFLSPPAQLLLDTTDLSTEADMSAALNRLEKAINTGEKIMINGDPDADGITGATILLLGLETLGAKVTFDFPTRAKEGHGLQPRIIDRCKNEGFNVLLSVDCGTRDNQATEYANKSGLDVIICDHHTLGRVNPKSLAMINPFMVKKKTLMQSLSGSGVAFKFMIALFRHMKRDLNSYLIGHFSALATLGTISDRMTLLNPQNRILIIKGTEAINNTQMEGLKALKKVCSPGNKYLKSRELARTIVPRLNAPGRIGDKHEGIPDSSIMVDILRLGFSKKDAQEAQELMGTFVEHFVKKKEKTASSEKAIEDVTLVEDVNERRKYITSKIEDEIEKLIEVQANPEKDRVIIIQGKNWNPGVIGIDTDRLKERFLKPAIILTEYENSEFIRGSVRSIPTINMYKIIDDTAEEFEAATGRNLFMVAVETVNGKQLINAFGGHAQACGFTLHQKDVPEFIRLVRKNMENLEDNSFEYHYEILETLTFKQVSKELITKLDRLIPFGQAFEFPTFYLKGCGISHTKPFGNKYQEARTPHVEFFVSNPDPKYLNQHPILAVGFGLWEKLKTLRGKFGPDQIYDIIFTLEEARPARRKNKKGKPNGSRIRLNVLDIRPVKS